VANGGDLAASRELVVTRAFEAPRGLVFAAWTEPERLKRWWGPRSFTMPFCEIDLRPGGVFLRCMRSPEGRDLWVTGVFREVVVPERLVFTDSFADAQGNVVSAARYGLGAGWPTERLVTVTFEDERGATRVTLRHIGIPSGVDLGLTRRGWSDGLDSLEEYLAKA
jgi:uncharacterized protein YndB with AHSA1/START domain